jgi:hypothetical protein
MNKRFSTGCYSLCVIAATIAVAAIATNTRAQPPSQPQAPAQAPALSPAAAAAPMLNTAARTMPINVMRPDIAFDLQAMNTDVANQTRRITVKNVGSGASKPFTVKCDATIDMLLFDGRKDRQATSDSFAVPALAAGASHATTGLNGAWVIEALKCNADSGATSGESNTANNHYDYRRNALSANLAAPIASASAAGAVGAATSQLTKPDLAFDTAAMNNEVLKRPVIIKNIGNRASTSAKVSCSGSTKSGEDALRAAGSGAGEALSLQLIPALAPGQTHAFPAGREITDTTRWTCTIFDVAGEANTANNQYQWQKTTISDALNARGELLQAPLITSRATAIAAPDLAFVTTKMRADADRSRGQIGYAIHVQNIGAIASRPSTVTCTDISDVTDPLKSYPSAPERMTWNWTRNVPSVAPGGAFSDQVEVLGNEDLIQRTCVIDAQSASGDVSKGNNTFSYLKAAPRTPLQSAIAQPVRPARSVTP